MRRGVMVESSRPAVNDTSLVTEDELSGNPGNQKINPCYK